MSDEAHIQAALRHADSVLLPWSSPAPDEEMMRREEGDGGEERWGWLLEEVLVFLFSDCRPDVWETVGLRALKIYQHCFPAVLARRSLMEEEAVKAGATGLLDTEFKVSDLMKFLGDEGSMEMLERIMNHLFPPRRRWLYKGTQRAYLLAKAYQPVLVRRRAELGDDLKVLDRMVQMSYEDIARNFEKDPLLTPKARSRARSRWSARAKELIRLPIERSGGVAHLRFGKSAEARAAMAAAAKGNQNRVVKTEKESRNVPSPSVDAKEKPMP